MKGFEDAGEMSGVRRGRFGEQKPTDETRRGGVEQIAPQRMNPGCALRLPGWRRGGERVVEEEREQEW